MELLQLLLVLLFYSVRCITLSPYIHSHLVSEKITVSGCVKLYLAQASTGKSSSLRTSLCFK